MAAHKPSRIRRFIGFVIFRLVPFGLILGTVWFSYNIVQAVARRVTEQLENNQRASFYVLTASAVEPTLITHTASPTMTATPSFTPTATHTPTVTHTPTFTPTSTPQPTLIAQVFATNTPRVPNVTIPALNTPLPAGDSTATRTITPGPPLTPLPTEAIQATVRPLPTLLRPGDPNLGAAAPTAIPTQVPPIDRQGYDLVNILLLGGDSELTGDNVDRTDTMIVVSINRTTNTINMLSLPRDLFVYIPGWTMQRLNLAYTRGEQVGWTDGGFGLMRQTIFYNFGINVHYYALVNLSGFKEIIDAVGGVDVAVDCAIKDQPLIGAPPPSEAQGPDDENYYVLPVGYYHLMGEGALWYARSRHNSIEFDRGRRQQQILRALWRAGRNTGQITRMPELWSQLTAVVRTDLSFEDMLGLLPYALSLDPDRIGHFKMNRLYHTTPWQPPDGSFVQLPNYEPVRELMEAFYRPPTESQVVIEGAEITVFNGTSNTDWDRVAAERLAWSGFKAVAAGAADNPQYADTILIDRSGQTKGSKLPDIVRILNVRPENVRIEPDPNRTADYEVILGSSYNSCTFDEVQDIEETAR
jgi:LCP family protein required for cell wall assembly